MAAWAEVLSDRTVSREEPLRVAGRFEPLHAPLPLTRRLMGVPGPVIEVPVLAMFDSQENLALGRSGALQFVGDEHARYVSQSLEEFAEELLCRLLVPAALDQDIQHVPLLIDCPPEIRFCRKIHEPYYILKPINAKNTTYCG